MISLSPRSSPPRTTISLPLSSISLPSSPSSSSLTLENEHSHSSFSSFLLQVNEPTIRDGAKALRHATFWFLDGTLVLRILDPVSGVWRLFRVHRDLIHRHSLVIPRLDVHRVVVDGDRDSDSLCEAVDCPTGIAAEDVETLLEHLYHDIPLSIDSSFTRLASALRVSSPKQLDFPAIHKLARDYIEKMFPSGPTPFYHPNCLEAALSLSVEFGITKVQKGLFYSLVTTSNFNTTPPAADETTPPSTPSTSTTPLPAPPTALSSADSHRLTSLMKNIIHHFTPILFTPPGASHMECTDALASAWMGAVIQPALADDGVYKPLETLERIKLIDWEALSICRACADEKILEWERVQVEVWEKVGEWLEATSS